MSVLQGKIDGMANTTKNKREMPAFLPRAKPRFSGLMGVTIAAIRSRDTHTLTSKLSTALSALIRKVSPLASRGRTYTFLCCQ